MFVKLFIGYVNRCKIARLIYFKFRLRNSLQVIAVAVATFNDSDVFP